MLTAILALVSAVVLIAAIAAFGVAMWEKIVYVWDWILSAVSALGILCPSWVWWVVGAVLVITLVSVVLRII